MEIECNGSCNEGWFNVLGTNKCLPCFDNYFNDHPGATQCKRCNLGDVSSGVLNSSTCVQKRECTCDGGTSAEGENCLFHGQEKCASCDSGKYLSEKHQVCVDGICNCSNGTVVDDLDCDSFGKEHCVSCDEYHVLEQNSETGEFYCRSFECICPRGQVNTEFTVRSKSRSMRQC